MTHCSTQLGAKRTTAVDRTIERDLRLVEQVRPVTKSGRAVRPLAGFARKLRSGWHIVTNALSNGRADETDHVSRLIADAGHELRTPMTGILGLSELLLGSRLEPQQLKHVDAIFHAARDLLALIEDILDHERLAAGPLELRATPFDLRTMIANVLELIEPTIGRKPITLRLLYNEQLPSHFVGQGVQLRQIVTNLVANAVKFTRAGGVTVTVTGHVERYAARVRVSVSDTGPGIPADQVGKIFEAFARGPAGRDCIGHGLGLSIARRLARQMGSDIAVDTVVDQGATFYFDLSLPVATLGPERSTIPQIDDRTPAAAVNGIMRVLVADDSPTNRLMMSAMLKSEHLALNCVSCGEDALTWLAEFGADLVLMDLSMPGLDGMETTRAIRLREAAMGQSRTPIVALTANAMRGDRDRCIASGMDDYLSKPIRKDKLLAAIEQWRGVKAGIVRWPDTSYSGPERRRGIGDFGAIADRKEMHAPVVDDQVVATLIDQIGPQQFDATIAEFECEMNDVLARLASHGSRNATDAVVSKLKLLGSCARSVGLSELARRCHEVLHRVSMSPTALSYELVELKSAKERALSSLEAIRERNTSHKI